jgi:cob(I)alamin adenosyltransferase
LVDEPADGEGGARRSAIRDCAVATGRGDDGTTGLLFGGARIAKDDPRTEAYGTVDEAVACLGIARAELGDMAATGELPEALTQLPAQILRYQRELFVVGAELAANPDAWDRLRDGQTRVSQQMVDALEADLAGAEAAIQMPREFTIPGETRLSAALELSRTVLRRAERRAITLQRERRIPGEWLVPYLNRLADLLWVLARAAEQGQDRPSIAARTGAPVRERSRRVARRDPSDTSLD